MAASSIAFLPQARCQSHQDTLSSRRIFMGATPSGQALQLHPGSSSAAHSLNGLRHDTAMRAQASPQPGPDQEELQEDAAREIMDEIAREDAQAAEQSRGKQVVQDLFPQGEAPRLSPRRQRERQAELAGRPLRSARTAQQPSRRTLDLLDARRQSDLGSMGTLARAQDTRTQRTLPSVPRLEPLANPQVQPDQASPYVPRPDGSDGIGSYARKVAQAGLGPMPHPKDVVYNHPVAAKARLEAAIAQGYDPDAEYRSMLGRLMTDDLDSPELDEDGQGPAAPAGQQSGSTTPDLDADFNEQLSEDEIREEQEVSSPEWDADMDVKDDYGNEGLGDDFDRALSETLATKEDDDREGFAVWEGDKDEVESIDDIVERLAGSEDSKDSSAQGKVRPGLKRTTFSWRDFGKNRPIRRSDQD